MAVGSLAGSHSFLAGTDTLFTAAALISATPKAQFPYSRDASFELGSPLSSADESEAEYHPSSPQGKAKVRHECKYWACITLQLTRIF
jgi:hypothetical protein